MVSDVFEEQSNGGTVLHADDFRNNSAWNQRYFVISNTKDLSSLDVKKEEIEYSLPLLLALLSP